MSKTRILTIEDDAAIRRGIVDALRFAGFEPLEAATGDAGRRLARECQFDLLLLDLVLPGCGVWRSWPRCAASAPRCR